MSEGEIDNIYERPSASGKPEALVILLHGLGSNGRDLISLSPYFAARLPGAVFISPDAPFACDMVPPGYPDSYQWFSLQDRDPDKTLKGVETAAPILQKFIADQIEKYAVPANKAALVGFSQGTMMSLFSALRYPEPLAGVLGYSGALVGRPGPNKMPIHLIHGEADDVVPIEAYHHAREILLEQGFDVSGHTTPGLTHSIDETGIKSGAEFLKSILV
ncbi:MAG: phospholipase [Rhodospirillales bacterium]|nr:phospholipase [Rhodospirillales bacterium]